MLRYTIDRARPGLVALYDIRPGNVAGEFLQPRSLHGVSGAVFYTLNGLTDTNQHHQQLEYMGTASNILK